MTDRTPSPQSVVVPVEPTEAMLKAGNDRTDFARVCWEAMLAAAPALAGGEERGVAARVLAEMRGHVECPHPSDYAEADAILAALSPEAPARVPEGGAVTDAMVEAACSRFVSESDDIWSASVWPEGLDDDGDRGDGGRVRLISEDDQHKIRAAMRFALHDALTPRHEAPAREGVALDKRIADAAERDRRERDKAFRGESYEPLTPTHEAPASEGDA